MLGGCTVQRLVVFIRDWNGALVGACLIPVEYEMEVGTGGKVCVLRCRGER